MVDSYSLARVLHIIAIVIWIGGVAMVTSVILPAVRRMPSTGSKVDLFEKIEGKFALQARIMTVITAITGFYMLYYIDGWERYFDYRFWWLHAMTLVWFLFTGARQTSSRQPLLISRCHL